MIYTGIATLKAPMKAIELDRDFDFFKTYRPQFFDYPLNDSEKLEIKRNKMLLVIAGEMVPNSSRSDENLLSRSLLFIDFDDITMEEEVFLSKIKKAFESNNFVLYPTLQHIPNDFLRYRLVLELDRSVNKTEYSDMIEAIMMLLEFKLDKSNLTWSQGQALPIKTSKNPKPNIIIQDGKERFPVDIFLKSAREKLLKNKASGKLKVSDAQVGQKRPTGAFLDEVVAGVYEGERNTWVASKIGSFLAYGMDPSNAYELGVVMNENFVRPPLDDAEFNRIFASILDREARKRS